MRPHRTLSSARDFARVRRRGRRIERVGMTVYVCGRESDRDPTRVGLAVSGGPRRAVARNRAKRRLRAAAAAALPRSGWDVVIRAQGDLDGISFQELRKALENVAPPSRQP